MAPSLPLKRKAIDLTEDATSDSDAESCAVAVAVTDTNDDDDDDDDNIGSTYTATSTGSSALISQSTCNVPSTSTGNSTSWAVPLADVVHMHFMTAIGDDNRVVKDLMCIQPEFLDILYEEETILRGFRSPKVDVYFCAKSLAPCILSSYTQRAPSAQYVDPADPITGFYADGEELDLINLPNDEDAIDAHVLIETLEEFEAHVRHEANTGPPPGDVVSRFVANVPASVNELVGAVDPLAASGEGVQLEYEIRHMSFEDPRARLMYRRMAILSRVLIDGGARMEPHDKRWRLLVIYARLGFSRKNNDDATHVFVGMLSYCRMYVHPEMRRLRIGQIFVLPAFRGQQLASQLYEHVMQIAENDPEVIDVTVDEPSTAFDTLSESCSLRRLSELCESTLCETRQKTLAALVKDLCVAGSLDDADADADAEANANVVVKKVQDVATNVMRLEPRQARRITELYLYLGLVRSHAGTTPRALAPNEIDSLPDWFRRYAKKRIFLHNREVFVGGSTLNAAGTRELSEDSKEKIQEVYLTSLIYHHPSTLEAYTKYLEKRNMTKQEKNKV